MIKGCFNWKMPNISIRIEMDSLAVLVKLLTGVVNGSLWRRVEAVVHGKELPCLQTRVGSVFGR